MNPPKVYEVTTPSNHKTNKTVNNVQSMVSPFDDRPTDIRSADAIQYRKLGEDRGPSRYGGDMKHRLPMLVDLDEGISGFLSRETLNFHYGKHHRAYVDKLNRLIEGTHWTTMDLETLVVQSHAQGEQAVFEQASQHHLHCLYWASIRKRPIELSRSGALYEEISRTWESLDAFRENFMEKAGSLFGSGWTCLIQDSEGRLSFQNHSNAGNPIVSSATPIVVCDVWEHAYYIDDRNDRKRYLGHFWEHIAWDEALLRYIRARPTDAVRGDQNAWQPQPTA